MFFRYFLLVTEKVLLKISRYEVSFFFSNEKKEIIFFFQFHELFVVKVARSVRFLARGEG